MPAFEYEAGWEWYTMWSFLCSDGHLKVEWVNEATFSLCPICKKQRAGTRFLGMHARVSAHPMGSTIIEAEAPVEVRLSVACWNVANLGGGFGWPQRRSNEAINAIAQVLVQQGGDINVILEVLQRSRRRPSSTRLQSLFGVRYRPKFIGDEFSAALFMLLASGLTSALNEPAPDLSILSGNQSSEVLAREVLLSTWNRIALECLESATTEEGTTDEDELSNALTWVVKRALAACKAYWPDLLSSLQWDAVRQELQHILDVALLDAKAQSEPEPSGSGGSKEHPGIAELQRIVAAMGSEWVLHLYQKDERYYYTRGETYGFICRKTVVTAVSFQDFIFRARAPLLAWCTVAGLPEPVGVLAHHSPSCSQKNKQARSVDFPRLAEVCAELRAKSGRIVVLAFDSNINTALGARDIPHFSGKLTIPAFFEALSGDPAWLARSIFRDALTSVRKSVVEHQLEAAFENSQLHGVQQKSGILLTSLIEDYVAGRGHEYMLNAFDKIVPVSLVCGGFRGEVISEAVHALMSELSKLSPAQRFKAARKMSDHVLVRIELLITNSTEPRLGPFSSKNTGKGLSAKALLDDGMQLDDGRDGWDGGAALLTGGGGGGSLIRIPCLAQSLPSCGQRAVFNALTMLATTDPEARARTMSDDAQLRQRMGDMALGIHADQVRERLDHQGGKDIVVVQQVEEVPVYLGQRAYPGMWSHPGLLDFYAGRRDRIVFVLHTNAHGGSGAAHWIAVELVRPDARHRGQVTARFADSLIHGADRGAVINALVKALGYELI